MAKKTRTELSTLAVNTNLPDNTSEQITPTTERAQLTEERDSAINYKDDLGGTTNAGKFLTVATDGESLTMVDEPSGVPDWVTFATASGNLMMLKSGSNTVQIQFYDSDGTTLGAQMTWDQVSSSLNITNSQSSETIQLVGGEIYLQTGGTTKLKVASTGAATFSTNSNSSIVNQFTNSDTTGGTSTRNTIELTAGNRFLQLQAYNDDHIYLNRSSGSDLYFQSGGSTELIISSGGNVLVGLANTATNVGKFEVETASAIAYTPTANITGTNLRLATGGTAATNVTTGDSMGIGGNAEAYIGAVQNSSGYADIVFQSYGGSYSEKMRISSGGLATFSNGIQFGTGSTLDKYEEGGTWTVSIISGGTVGYTPNSKYTIIGNICYFSFYSYSISITSNSSELRISLPVAGDTTTGDYTSASIAYSGSFNTSTYLPIVNDGTGAGTYIYFHKNNGSSSAVLNSDATSLTELIISGWYYV